jgi:uncharacterized damage-inducible protein DinB
MFLWSQNNGRSIFGVIRVLVSVLIFNKYLVELTCKILMSAELELLKEQKVVRALSALQRARSLRNTRRTIGVSGICQHISDVDGDWLENWTDTQNAPANNEADKDTVSE